MQVGRDHRAISQRLTDVGGRRFAHLSADLVGKQLAIVAGVVVAAPTVQSAITGGRVEIVGQLTKAQASGIAAACLLGRDPVRVRSGNPG